MYIMNHDTPPRERRPELVRELVGRGVTLSAAAWVPDVRVLDVLPCHGGFQASHGLVAPAVICRVSRRTTTCDGPLGVSLRVGDRAANGRKMPL